MALFYKINVLEALKNKGYSNLHKYFGGTDLQKMRNNIVIGIISLEKLCQLLEMQPGDIIGYENK